MFGIRDVHYAFYCVVLVGEITIRFLSVLGQKAASMIIPNSLRFGFSFSLANALAGNVSVQRRLLPRYKPLILTHASAACCLFA